MLQIIFSVQSINNKITSLYALIGNSFFPLNTFQTEHRGRKSKWISSGWLARCQLHLAQVVPAGPPQVVHQQWNGEKDILNKDS